MLPKHFKFFITLSTSRNQLCNITANPNKNVHPISLQQIQTLYWSGLTFGIGSLRGNFFHRNIRGVLLGSAVVVRRTGLSNRCMFGFDNQQAGKYISATEVELVRFCLLPLGDLVWHLRTQLNDSDISA